MTHRFSIASRIWPWKYVRLKGDNDGYAFTPEPGDKRPGHKVLIDDRLRGRKRFRIELHEFLHAAFPDVSEDVIDKRSRELTTILWSLGYRRRP
jgi:hypothetical protein